MRACEAPSRLETHAAEQRWAQVRELCAGEQIELLRVDGRQLHRLIGDADTLSRQAVKDAEPIASDQPHSAKPRVLVIDLLLADRDTDPVADVVAEASEGERQTIVWADPRDLPALLSLSPVLSGGEIFEQVPVEGVVMARPDAEVISTDVDVTSSLRESVTAIVVCTNLAGLAGRAAAKVTVLEAGSERTHLVTSLTELRRANFMLGKAQGGKSQGAASRFIKTTERRLMEEFEERQRVEKDERDAWVASLLSEIIELKAYIESLEAHIEMSWAQRLMKRVHPRRPPT